MLSHERTLDLIDAVGRGVDIFGVAVIVAGLCIASALAVRAVTRGHPIDHSLYAAYRLGLGRTILLGLEILVVADIITTVAVEPTFESIGVLALIVLIRTFLSISLELEITGRWPWQPLPPQQTPSHRDPDEPTVE